MIHCRRCEKRTVKMAAAVIAMAGTLLVCPQPWKETYFVISKCYSIETGFWAAESFIFHKFWRVRALRLWDLPKAVF